MAVSEILTAEGFWQKAMFQAGAASFLRDKVLESTGARTSHHGEVFGNKLIIAPR